MRKTKITMQLDRAIRHIVILMPLVFPLPSAFSQVVKLTSKPRPQASGNSLSLTASPASVSFSLVSQGTATGSGSVSITVTTDFSKEMTVNIYGFFASATSALKGQKSGALIPSSAVLGQVPHGLPSSFTPFTQSAPFGGAGAGLELVSTPVSEATDPSELPGVALMLNLEINLGGHVLPADTYTGTLTIQAQAP
jgi:hypothetical protein